MLRLRKLEKTFQNPIKIATASVNEIATVIETATAHDHATEIGTATETAIGTVIETAIEIGTVPAHPTDLSRLR